MNGYLAIVILLAGFCATAQADVWMWVDAEGERRFVDTNTPIYTWKDERGEVRYSDTPDHEDAVSVELVPVSSESLADLVKDRDRPEWHYAYSSEAQKERARRKKAQAYRCKRATDIYVSYVNAPRLYKTNDRGEREYLSEEEAARTIAEIRSQKDEYCQ